MELKEVVQKYLAVAGGYGKTVPLESLGLSQARKSRVCSALSTRTTTSAASFTFSAAAGADYKINGFPQSHVSIDAEIQAIL